jgi:hypothetical protein
VTAGAFITKWSGTKGGAERANYVSFFHDLCDMLAIAKPEPAVGGELGSYQFDGLLPGGSNRTPGGNGWADLYKEGCFVLEAKQSLLKEGESEPPRPEGGTYDRLMRGAYAQARHYAANIPADRPNVPFLIVADIGRAFEIY